MNSLKTVALILGISSLMLLASLSPGNCFTPPPLPMGTGQEAFPGLPPGPMPGPGPGPMPGPFPGPGPGLSPFGLGDCGAQSCGPGLGIEVGGRAYYTTNIVKWKNDQGADVDFIEDLHFSRNTLLGEIYGALRMPPWGALSYTFTFPRLDNGHGTLLGDLVIGQTLFPAGTQITAKIERTIHRWEGEYFIPVGCSLRVGPYLMGELFVQKLTVDDGTVSESRTFQEFIMGVGGSAEFAPAYNFFLKGKAAYTFLQNQSGVFVDVEGRFFPDLASCGVQGMTGSLRPYLGAGYRLRQSTRFKEDDRENNNRFELTIHGPYASVSVVF